MIQNNNLDKNQKLEQSMLDTLKAFIFKDLPGVRAPQIKKLKTTVLRNLDEYPQVLYVEVSLRSDPFDKYLYSINSEGVISCGQTTKEDPSRFGFPEFWEEE